jgi:hypothetical protein
MQQKGNDPKEQIRLGGIERSRPADPTFVICKVASDSLFHGLTGLVLNGVFDRF